LETFIKLERYRENRVSGSIVEQSTQSLFADVVSSRFTYCKGMVINEEKKTTMAFLEVRILMMLHQQ
ncbi:hypothetical protein A4A49_52941, partial [Nicotiana attenuata]